MKKEIYTYNIFKNLTMNKKGCLWGNDFVKEERVKKKEVGGGGGVEGSQRVERRR